MILEGKIKQLVSTQEGTSRAGREWKKAQYILETNDQYPRTIAFAVFNDKINEFSLLVGQDVRLGVDIESHEWNGKWFTEVTAQAILDTPTSTTQPAPTPTPAPTAEANVDVSNDLPF